MKKKMEEIHKSEFFFVFFRLPLLSPLKQKKNSMMNHVVPEFQEIFIYPIILDPFYVCVCVCDWHGSLLFFSFILNYNHMVVCVCMCLSGTKIRCDTFFSGFGFGFSFRIISFSNGMKFFFFVI